MEYSSDVSELEAESTFWPLKLSHAAEQMHKEEAVKLGDNQFLSRKLVTLLSSSTKMTINGTQGVH